MIRIGVVLLTVGTVTAGFGAVGISEALPSFVMGGVMAGVGLTVTLIGRSGVRLS